MHGIGCHFQFSSFWSWSAAGRAVSFKITQTMKFRMQPKERRITPKTKGTNTYVLQGAQGLFDIKLFLRLIPRNSSDHRNSLRYLDSLLRNYDRRATPTNHLGTCKIILCPEQAHLCSRDVYLMSQPCASNLISCHRRLLKLMPRRSDAGIRIRCSKIANVYLEPPCRRGYKLGLLCGSAGENSNPN